MALLVPTADPLISQQHGVEIVTGAEHDVLSRYMKAVDTYNPEYVCRITSDCPLIPPFLIMKHIYKAVNHKFDYTSNTDPRCRTAPDGWDCEVLSVKLMRWLNDNAQDISFREHVTNMLYTVKPDWCKTAHIVSYLDNNHLKLSVDTKEDLEFVRDYNQILQNKIDIAKNTGGGFFRV